MMTICAILIGFFHLEFIRNAFIVVKHLELGDLN